MNGHKEDTELLGLLGGQEKGSEGYKGDGISTKDGMIEPCPVRSNCGSCWGLEEAPLADMDRRVCSCRCSSKHLGGFSGLGPEDLTSNRGSWLLGRKRLWKQASRQTQGCPKRCWMGRFRGR